MIRTSKKTLYTGIATDVARRFAEHYDVFAKKTGARGAKYFRTCEPLSVVYQAECGSRAEATRQERQLKAMPRVEKERLITNAARRDPGD